MALVIISGDSDEVGLVGWLVEGREVSRRGKATVKRRDQCQLGVARALVKPGQRSAARFAAMCRSSHEPTHSVARRRG